MLLERLEPGTPLTAIRNDKEATATVADVMNKLRGPAPADHAFPTVSDWARGFDRLGRRFDGGTGPIPARLVEEAESLWGMARAVLAAYWGVEDNGRVRDEALIFVRLLEDIGD